MFFLLSFVFNIQQIHSGTLEVCKGTKQFHFAYQNKVYGQPNALPSLAFLKPLEYPISCALLLHQVFVQMPVDPCMPVIQEQGPAPKKTKQRAY